MRVRPLLKGTALLAIGAAMLPGWASKAAPPTPAEPPVPGAVPGWTDFLDGLRDLPERILARLPADQRNDPQIRQEVGRLALSAVAAATIDALAADPDHPVFLPQINNYITTGQPNADTNYRSAKIAPGGIYRLRGRRGSMNQASFAEVGPRPKQTEGTVNLGKPRPVHDLNALKVDAEGRYDVLLSPTRPEDYTGDWWQLDPTSNMLLVRMVGSRTNALDRAPRHCSDPAAPGRDDARSQSPFHTGCSRLHCPAAGRPAAKAARGRLRQQAQGRRFLSDGGSRRPVLL
jgi:hypothetical protein